MTYYSHAYNIPLNFSLGQTQIGFLLVYVKTNLSHSLVVNDHIFQMSGENLRMFFLVPHLIVGVLHAL